MWGQHVHGVTSSLLELARELGFTEEQVHQIRIENPNSLQDQSHALLRHWLERDCRPAAGRAAGARRAGPRAERGVPTGPQVPAASSTTARWRTGREAARRTWAQVSPRVPVSASAGEGSSRREKLPDSDGGRVRTAPRFLPPSFAPA